MLYHNGTISFAIRRTIRILCNFTFQNMPFDAHTCPIQVFVINEDKDSVKLELLNPREDYPINSTTTRDETFDQSISSFLIRFDYKE